jgi:hypothetical protein
MSPSDPKSEKELMKLRKSFIEFYKQVGDVTLTCKTFNISRPTFYKWYKRYDPNDPTTLIDESKAPKTKRKPNDLTTHSFVQKNQSDEELLHTLASPPLYQGTQKVTPTPYQTQNYPNNNTPIGNTAFQHPLASLFQPPKNIQNNVVITEEPMHPPVVPTYVPQKHYEESIHEPTVMDIQQQSIPYHEQPRMPEHIPIEHPIEQPGPSVGSLLRDRMQAHTQVESSMPTITVQRKQQPIYQENARSYQPKNTFNDNQSYAEKNYTNPVPSKSYDMPDNREYEQIQPKEILNTPKPQVRNVLKTFQSSVQSISKSKSFLKNKNGLLFLGVTIAIVIGIIPSFFFYQSKTKSDTAGSNAVAPESNDIIKKVGAFMELPKDEDPTIATVTDLEKLRGQPFFANAKKGDVVLIYDKAARIILFDPVANKIINAASTNVETPTTPTPAPQTVDPNKTYRVGLLNGTEITGLTRTVEKNLLEKLDKIAIGARDNAKKQGYTQTLIVDLTGQNADMANKVATALRGAVSPLPEGEITPPLPTGEGALDLLAIIGSDYVKQ